MKKVFIGLYLVIISNCSFSQNTFPTGAGTNAGIGTTAPVTALHIFKNSTTLNAGNFITIDNRGSNTSYTTTHVIGGMLFAGWRDVKNPANVAGIWAVRSSASGGLNSQGDIVFGTTPDNPTNIATDNVLPPERMRITSTGLVGINRYPETALDINGIIRAGGVMSSGSNIGDNLTHNGLSVSHYSVTWQMDSWMSGAATAWLSGYGGIKLFTGGANRINIDVNGNTGIGTATPVAKLDVNGNIRVNAESQFSVGAFADPDAGTSHAIKVGSNGIAVNGNSVFSNGYVMIGSYPSQMNTLYLLNVNGPARVNKLVVNSTGADFVFEPTYKLAPLNKVEEFIQANHRLPGIEPAAQMQKDGLDVGTNQTKLLQKIEELTLYVIEQDKNQQVLAKQNETQNTIINTQAKILQQQQELLQQLQVELNKLKTNK